MIEEKLQSINNQLFSLLPMFKKICLTNFINLPYRIDEVVIGEDNLSSFVDGSIQEITKDDLKGMTDIDFNIFRYCNNLKKVTTPDAVSRISNSSGQNIVIPHIYVNSITPPTLDVYFHSDVTIHIPIGCGNTYKSATNWSKYASQIVEDIVIE